MERAVEHWCKIIGFNELQELLRGNPNLGQVLVSLYYFKNAGLLSFRTTHYINELFQLGNKIA